MAEQLPSKKRDQIAKSNRVMFIWVASMSAVVGVCLVVSYFLWQQLVFRSQVVNAKNDTANILEDNNDTVEELKQNIRVLETNTALGAAKADEDEKALQVILDALPADNNPAALGASLQQKLISSIPNISLESLSFEESDTNSSSGDESSSTSSTESGATHIGQISFNAVVKSNDINALRDLLSRFEKSVRVIDLDSAKVESSGADYTLTIDAHAYYLPAKKVELYKVEIEP